MVVHHTDANRNKASSSRHKGFCPLYPVSIMGESYFHNIFKPELLSINESLIMSQITRKLSRETLMYEDCEDCQKKVESPQTS